MPYWVVAMLVEGTPQPLTVEYAMGSPLQADAKVTLPLQLELAVPQLHAEQVRLSVKPS